jgi:hypothetical protein
MKWFSTIVVLLVAAAAVWLSSSAASSWSARRPASPKLGKTFGRPAGLNAKQRAMIAERYAAGATMAESEVVRRLSGDFEE